jgi:hypothetical protein
MDKQEHRRAMDKEEHRRAMDKQEHKRAMDKHRRAMDKEEHRRAIRQGIKRATGHKPATSQQDTISAHTTLLTPQVMLVTAFLQGSARLVRAGMALVLATALSQGTEVPTTLQAWMELAWTGVAGPPVTKCSLRKREWAAGRIQ